MSINMDSFLIRFMRSKVAVYLFTLVSLGLIIYGGRIAVLLATDNISTTPPILYDIGAAPVSLEQLKSETNDHGLSFYWLGEEPNRYMAINHQTPGVISLAYTNNSDKNSVVDTPEVVVTTHIDEDHYAQSMNGAVHVAVDNVVSNSKGDVVIINSSLLNEMLVKPRGTQKVVTITYSEKQSESALIRDSEKLSLFDPA